MSAPVEVHLLCLLGVILAVYFMLKCRYGIFVKYKPYLLLFGVSGIPDMLATVEFAYLYPELEANPLTKMFLGIPYAICAGVFLWTFMWLSIVEFAGRKSTLLPKIILCCLFIGHLIGFATWLKYLDLITLLLICAATMLALSAMLVMVEKYEKIKQQ